MPVNLWAIQNIYPKFVTKIQNVNQVSDIFSFDQIQYPKELLW